MLSKKRISHNLSDTPIQCTSSLDHERVSILLLKCISSELGNVLKANSNMGGVLVDLSMCSQLRSKMQAYLHQFMYLLPCTKSESLLFGNTVLNFGEVYESRAKSLSGNKSPAAEFNHESLNGFSISFATLDPTRNVLKREL